MVFVNFINISCTKVFNQYFSFLVEALFSFYLLFWNHGAGAKMLGHSSLKKNYQRIEISIQVE